MVPEETGNRQLEELRYFADTGKRSSSEHTKMRMTLTCTIVV
jgi:hypothetical protein